MDVVYNSQGVNENIYLTKVVRSVRTHTVSKTEDARFVFIGIITILSGSGATLEDVDAEDRLRKVLRPPLGYGNVPGNIVLLYQRRYEQGGCWWIPRSFLRQKSPLGTSFFPETGREDRAHSQPCETHM